MDGTATDRRSQILLAAAKVFAAKGFHKAKVEEIASEAEVGKGTVYEYFSSKKHLFQEMLKTGSKFYLDLLGEKLADAQTATEKLQRIVSIHLNLMKSHKDIGKILLSEPVLDEGLGQWMLERQQEKLLYVRKLLEAGVAAQEFKEGLDVDTAANVFFGAIALCGQKVLLETDVDVERLSSNIMEIFLSGIAG